MTYDFKIQAQPFTIKNSDYIKFKNRFYAKEFGSQRMGQAFYSEFNLDKFEYTSQDSFRNLYNETDTKKVENTIQALFIEY